MRATWLGVGWFQAVDLALRFPGDDFHVAAEARFMSFVWNREWSKRTDTEFAAGGVALPVNIRFFKASDGPVYWKELEAGRRFCTFNLSARIRAVKQALESETE